MHRHRGQDLFNKGLAALALAFEPGPVDAMCKLYDSDCREIYLGLATRLLDLRKNLRYAVAAALGCYDDAGVKDQSHGRGFQGCLWWTISSTSAAKSGSRVTA